MKRTIGYAISDNNNFNSWSYNKYSIYYLAKIVEEYDKNTGECKNRYFEELSPIFAYRNKKIESFRNLKVYEKNEIILSLNGYFGDFKEINKR